MGERSRTRPTTLSPLYVPVGHTQPNIMSRNALQVYSSNGAIQSDNLYPASSSHSLSYPQSDLPRVRTTMEYTNSFFLGAPCKNGYKRSRTTTFFPAWGIGFIKSESGFFFKIINK